MSCLIALRRIRMPKTDLKIWFMIKTYANSCQKIRRRIKNILELSILSTKTKKPLK
jgi:hypothetical protein